jgi:hypothetical protein
MLTKNYISFGQNILHIRTYTHCIEHAWILSYDGCSKNNTDVAKHFRANLLEEVSVQV